MPANEAQRISTALGRTITTAGIYQVQIVQTCPMCRIELSMWIEDNDHIEAGWLQRQLFSFYDQHRCTLTDVNALFEAAERELVRSAERITAIPDPVLRARAELEADRMAAFADELRRRMIR